MKLEKRKKTETGNTITALVVSCKNMPSEEFEFWNIVRRNQTKIVKFGVWLLSWVLISYYLEFGMIYLCGSIAYWIFTNLGTREEGEISAYSMFNNNFEKIAGTFGADLYEKMLRKGNKNEKIDSNSIYAGTTQTLTKDELNKRKRNKNSKNTRKKNKNKKSLTQHPKRLAKHGNKPCMCGSGLKYKKCCMKQILAKQREKINQQLENENYYLSSDLESDSSL